jgi:hypothetical protein
MQSELPDNVLTLVRQCLPTYAAAEFLLLIRKVEKFESVAELCALRQPPGNAGEVEGYLALFQVVKLLRYRDGAFHFEPETETLKTAVEDLAVCYNERPVTLIRTIYALGGLKIQTFADAFKIKEV